MTTSFGNKYKWWIEVFACYYQRWRVAGRDRKQTTNLIAISFIKYFVLQHDMNIGLRLSLAGLTDCTRQIRKTMFCITTDFLMVNYS